MNWLPARSVIADTKMPAGYELLQLRCGDVPELVKRLGEWFPDIAVGAESCHLAHDF